MRPLTSNILTPHYRGPRRKREKIVENLLEKNMTENFPNLEKKADIQIHDAQRISNKMNPKRSTKDIS